MKQLLLLPLFALLCQQAGSWGFYAHRRINYYAVFLLPPAMLGFYKRHIDYLSLHAVDPDKRRYLVPAEGPRHYIDLNRYGTYPFDSLPRGWTAALERYGADTLQQHGIVPWWLQVMQARLTAAFRERDPRRILQLSAELGHYLSDAHVPLHAHSNHDGQYTGQRGIHGFWESRLPELLAEEEWDFFLGPAQYIADRQAFVWARVLESALAADSVLAIEKELSLETPADRRYAFEPRNGVVVRQYAAAYARAYDARLRGMVERRMRQSVQATASFWYTAWVDAGQPDLQALAHRPDSADLSEWKALDAAWRSGQAAARKCE